MTVLEFFHDEIFILFFPTKPFPEEINFQMPDRRSSINSYSDCHASMWILIETSIIYCSTKKNLTYSYSYQE